MFSLIAFLALVYGYVYLGCICCVCVMYLLCVHTLFTYCVHVLGICTVYIFNTIVHCMYFKSCI